MIRWLVGAIGLSMLATTSVLAADPMEIGIGYLRRPAVKPALSLVEQPICRMARTDMDLRNVPESTPHS